MKCGNCGRVIADNAKFCTYCGQNISGQQGDNQVKGSFLIAILSLLGMIVIIVTGGVWLIVKEFYPTAYVSASDTSVHAFDTTGTRSDAALVGQWLSTDRAAVDYASDDYGIEVTILLIMGGDGSFHLHYTMADTGVQAVNTDFSGSYSAQKNIVTFRPNLSDSSADYFIKHGSMPAFPYKVDADSFILTYEDGRKITFRKVS